MNIHEHQAKAVLREFGAPLVEGYPAFTIEEAMAAAKKLPGPIRVVKAQIHAGGRGKGGGVKIAKSLEEVETYANEILGMQLITPQTDAAGKKVSRIFIEAGADIADEFYLSMLVDRASSRVAFVVSTEGGMDIEAVAEETPEKIITIQIDPVTGCMPHHARRIAQALGLKGAVAKQCGKLIPTLYKAFTEKDMSMLEINPLIVTKGGDLLVLDAKVGFDPNALFRHPDIMEMRDPSEEDPMELKASEFDLSYVKLDGNIGCMVNGAGLAMATMDIIKHYGSEPANFLDVGGGATKEKVTEAFKIITSDPNVNGILVNIFGGIMKCDIIAEGIVAAVKEVGLEAPLVVRLEGTNVEKGKEILANSGLKITPANDLEDAAQKIVAATKG